MKLAVCDIDNTLVVKHMPLSEYSTEMIYRLKEAGWLFGLGSGRAIDQIRTLEEQWKIKCDVIIGLNGCEIYDGIDDKLEKLYIMEPEWIKEALEIMKPFKSTPSGSRNGVWVSLDDGTGALEASRKYLQGNNQFILLDDISGFYQDYMDKICFRVSADDMPAIEEHVAKFKYDKFKPVKTENTMMEFCNINGSKGKLLTYFCEKHGIDKDDVWAFGDMSNDIDMLKAAGHSVCMENGSDEVKAISEYVTEKPISEDGWAYFVEHHLL